MLLLALHHLGDSWKSAREALTSRLLCFTTGFPGSPKGLPPQHFSISSNAVHMSGERQDHWHRRDDAGSQGRDEVDRAARHRGELRRVSETTREAFLWAEAPRYLLRDRDQSYGEPYSQTAALQESRKCSRFCARPGRIIGLQIGAQRYCNCPALT